MAKDVKETRYRKTFTVRVGTISSVFDMMRYDHCFPATEEDAGKLERIGAGQASATDHDVNFTSLSLRPDSAPDAERWASFGCQVVSRSGRGAS